jgi:hypothetical protein
MAVVVVKSSMEPLSLSLGHGVRLEVQHLRVYGDPADRRLVQEQEKGSHERSKQTSLRLFVLRWRIIV